MFQMKLIESEIAVTKKDGITKEKYPAILLGQSGCAVVKVYTSPTLEIWTITHISTGTYIPFNAFYGKEEALVVARALVKKVDFKAKTIQKMRLRLQKWLREEIPVKKNLPDKLHIWLGKNFPEIEANQ